MERFDMKRCLFLLIFVAFLGIVLVSLIETNTWTHTTMLSLIPVLTSEHKKDSTIVSESLPYGVVGSGIEDRARANFFYDQANQETDENNRVIVDGSQIEHNVGEKAIYEVKQDTVNNIKKDVKWKIMYNEVKLRKEVNQIHESNYKVKRGDTCIKSVPDCIIVGVAKCGTRELVDFMSVHPKIITKHANGYQINKSIFGQSSARTDVAALMPCKYHDQISVVKADSFLQDKSKPDEIFKLNPKMKIIAIIREPASRVLSHLSFRAEKHKNKRKDISKDMKSKFAKMDFSNLSYSHPPGVFRKSIYHEGLERYMEKFKRNNVLVIESDEFKTDPTGVIERVENFFGIKSFVSKNTYAFNPKKKFYCIRKTKSVTPTMVCYENNRGRKKITLDQDTMNKMRNYFKPHNENLYRLIGKRYNW